MGKLVPRSDSRRTRAPKSRKPAVLAGGRVPAPVLAPKPCDPTLLRQCGWEIGASGAAERYQTAQPFAGLVAAAPRQGFVYWHIPQAWVEQTSRQRGPAWQNCRLVVRLYDVTSIEFNGFNARRVQDLVLPGISGQMSYALPSGGSAQVAEAGFLLRSNEFVPAVRSNFVQFAPDGASGRSETTALHVDHKLRPVLVENLWDHERFLKQHRAPKLRSPLRIAAFAMESAATGQSGLLPKFVSELALHQHKLGHDVHVFVPRRERPSGDLDIDGVTYHLVDNSFEGSPIDVAFNFGRVAEQRMLDLPHFDLCHLHEWQTGMASWLGMCPAVVSLSSIEPTRLNGAEPGELSREIQNAEQEFLRTAECILAPGWLCERIASLYGVDAERIREIEMDGRLPNEWEQPLDAGVVKKELGFDAGARVLAYVGPVEYASGLDVLVESWRTVLERHPSARLAIAGLGSMQRHLAERANALGIGYAVRQLGHLEGRPLTRLLRASEALILPSHQRWNGDEGVVELARRAGRAVITTKGGPEWLVRHEENGIVTYDNPGSMVWAMDRLLGNPDHARRMGQNGKRDGGTGSSWPDVAKYCLSICAEFFPELTIDAG